MFKFNNVSIIYMIFFIMLSGHSFAAEITDNDKLKINTKPAVIPSPFTAKEIDELLTIKFQQGHYSSKGADTCLKCHDGESEQSAMGIFDNVHGQIEVAGSPFTELQCETCHGPVGEHGKRVRKGKLREPMISFGMRSLVDKDKQNSVCFSCHEDRQRLAWQGSSHQSEQIPCATCHQVHQGQDPMQFKQQQNQLCGSCHKEQLQATQKRSSHPLKSAQMVCADCHNPHGSFNEHELNRSSTNRTCYQCHSEKRGPLLWEHEPVTEDCSICHDAHGSINANLLKQRTPQLCQDCHIPADHPSTMQAGDDFVVNAKSAFVLGKNCMTCHSLIHGSNHPAGQTFQR
jgi:DmsE family decaheme c-type cytochrome